jgi:hypothetical protein
MPWMSRPSADCSNCWARPCSTSASASGCAASTSDRAATPSPGPSSRRLATVHRRQDKSSILSERYHSRDLVAPAGDSQTPGPTTAICSCCTAALSCSTRLLCADKGCAHLDWLSTSVLHWLRHAEAVGNELLRKLWAQIAVRVILLILQFNTSAVNSSFYYFVYCAPFFF